MHCFCRNILPGILAGFFSVLFSAPLHAQTAGRLEALLDKPVLNWSEAAAFILEASQVAISGNQPDISDPLDAFNFALEHKWLPKKVSSEDAVSLNGLSLLLMHSFSMKGGIFYSILKSPHHAYRELVYKQVIRGDSDPAMIVSGPELLLIVSRLLTMEEAQEAEHK